MKLICEGSKKSKDDAADMISKGVLGMLGRPRGFHKVAANNVYGTRWRVDVWCEVRPDVYQISHSYFVVATEGGEIVTSDPAIIKTY